MMMSFERVLKVNYDRILDPLVASDDLMHGWGKPVTAQQIGAAIRQLDPAVWGLAVENARQATTAARARNQAG